MKTNVDEAKTKAVIAKKHKTGQQNPKQEISTEGVMASAFAKALKK
jgi:hypothetical protein